MNIFHEPDPYTMFSDLPTEQEFAEAYAWRYNVPASSGRQAYADCLAVGNTGYIVCMVDAFRHRRKES